MTITFPLKQFCLDFFNNLKSRKYKIFIYLFVYQYTVKGARGKVSFDSQNDKYASKLSSDASPEAYLSLRKLKSAFAILEIRCDKYASGEA
jgi:hypothetical protein